MGKGRGCPQIQMQVVELVRWLNQSMTGISTTEGERD
jgi:hypothetical protein